MKKSILIVFILISISSISFAQDSLIIPQSDNIYGDLYAFAEKGYIRSVDADHFKYNPISSYEAAGYICEALISLAQAPADTKSKKADLETLKKYYETYKAKAVEIYNKTNEMREKLKAIEATLESPEIKEFNDEIDTMRSGLFDIEQEMKLTIFRGVPPFKVMGEIQARWQDIESFGVSHVHQTSLGGTFMQLWTEYIVTSDVSFKLNITFERPHDEADKSADYQGEELPEFWGTGQRFLDTYTIDLNAFGWRASTGFFWEDITPFIAKQILTERPVLFDRDPYALEETARGHYENVFLHSFQKRGDIWSKHGWYGIGLYNMDFLLNSIIKVMAGKAEKFDERWDKHYLYEYAGRWTLPLEVKGLIDNSAISANFFNTSNELSEVETELADFSPPVFPDYNNFPGDASGFIQSQTIAGGDFNLNLLDTVSLGSEVEHATFNARMPKPYTAYPNDDPPAFTQIGNAIYAKAGIDLKPIKLEIKYTQIDPDYVATASAVLDTSTKTWTPTTGVTLSNYTYAGDPTMLWNNVKRASIFANIDVPNGFLLLNYGASSQIRPTGNQLYMEHFLFGNRLNGAIYWHLFYSNYGSPSVPPGPDDIYTGFRDYNTNGQGVHTMVTNSWLTNQEIITSNYAGGDTIKYYNNASAEFRYQLNKLLGIDNDFFVQAYGELDTLDNNFDVMVDYSPAKLLCEQIVSAFAVYNLTRKINIMATWGIERWTTDECLIPVDYRDTMYGVGFDYDFAPRTALFVRVKKFIHEDAAIPANNFNGWQLYAELKNFF